MAKNPAVTAKKGCSDIRIISTMIKNNNSKSCNTSTHVSITNINKCINRSDIIDKCTSSKYSSQKITNSSANSRDIINTSTNSKTVEQQNKQHNKRKRINLKSKGISNSRSRYCKRSATTSEGSALEAAGSVAYEATKTTTTTTTTVTRCHTISSRSISRGCGR